MSIADNGSGNGRAGQTRSDRSESRSALRNGNKKAVVRPRKTRPDRPRKNGKRGAALHTLLPDGMDGRSSQASALPAAPGLRGRPLLDDDAEDLDPPDSLDTRLLSDTLPEDARRAPREEKRGDVAEEGVVEHDVESLSSEELCRRYQKEGDAFLRDSLAVRHLSDVTELARYLSMRLPKSVDLEDLSNAGYSGLLRCIETFDPDRGRGFVSYMKQRVYGAMVDELRAMDWLPRLMRSRLSHRDQLFQELRQDLGRDPSDEEIAVKLDIDVSTYRRTYSSAAAKLGAGLLTGTEFELDQLESCIVGLGLRGKDAGDTVHPLTPLYHQELMGKIQQLLSETEWSLVELHYFEGLKLREVAERLRFLRREYAKFMAGSCSA